MARRYESQIGCWNIGSHGRDSKKRFQYHDTLFACSWWRWPRLPHRRLAFHARQFTKHRQNLQGMQVCGWKKSIRMAFILVACEMRKFTVDKFLVSKHTVVLCRRESETWKFVFTKRVDKGRITTVKDLESWRQLSKSFTVVIRSLSTHLIKPNFHASLF